MSITGRGARLNGLAKNSTLFGRAAVPMRVSNSATRLMKTNLDETPLVFKPIQFKDSWGKYFMLSVTLPAIQR